MYGRVRVGGTGSHGTTILGGQRTFTYICWHDREDGEADHRDPAQWTFYLVPTTDLPPVKQLALGSVRQLTNPGGFSTLRSDVDAAARLLIVKD